MHPAMSTWFGGKSYGNLFRKRFRRDLYWRLFGDWVIRGFGSGLASHVRVVYFHVAHFHSVHFVLTGGLRFDLFGLPLLHVAVAAGRVARAKGSPDHVAPRTKEERHHQECYRKRPHSHGSDAFNKLCTIAGIIFDDQAAILFLLYFHKDCHGGAALEVSSIRQARGQQP